MTHVIEIRNFRTTFEEGLKSDIGAYFDVVIGDFTLHDCRLRVHHDSSVPFVTMPGRKQGGISLGYHSRYRKTILAAAIELYEDATQDIEIID